MANRTSRYLFSLLLVLSFITASLPTVAHAQAGTAAAASSGYEKALAEIEAKVDARRKELGIPGISLVIVKDDKPIYMKGLGYKDFENKVAVTADTQFAIGSATKAFTALSVLMTADEGKLSLDDSPKKLLPYFRMYDTDTDKNITIRDLMCHSSGLNRTDLAMITGRLSRAELIQVAAQSKPTAKLREKFQYQNIMFAAAGELVTQAQKQPWERFVPERIFKPLGMTNSTMSISQMEKAKDFSFGYEYNFDTKETIKKPFRELDQVAPAGSINSSARDMAEWLRFVLNGGTAGGKRLVSEKSYAEWLKPQMKMNPTGTANYALGWMLGPWNGLTVVQHGGNIDGFNSLVAMIPEKKLGFVLLTNVSGSSLGNDLMPIVWSNLIPEAVPSAARPAAGTGSPESEAGKYRFEAAGFDIDIAWKDGKLVATVPGQPQYVLENVGGRKYKLTGAPDGFFMTFKGNELFLEQPQGDYTLPRVGNDGKPASSSGAAAAAPSGAAKDLVGTYLTPAGIAAIEIKESGGKVTFNITGQQPYELKPRPEGGFLLSPLPESYWLRPKLDAAGKLTSVVVTQPEGEFEFKRSSGTEAANYPSIDELYKKAIDAIGGEAAWRKLTSRVTEADVDLENQGVKAKVTSWAKAPNKSASETVMTALNKEIARGWDYFDGTGGEQIYSFAPADKFTGKRLDDARLGADFYAPLDWSAKYKRVAVTGITKIDGEDAYVVDFEPKAGSAFKEYYSTKTFLVLRRDAVESSSTSSVQIPYTVTFSDYREIDGIKLPYKTVTNSISNGNIVTVLTSVKHNVSVDDKTFAPRKVK